MGTFLSPELTPEASLVLPASTPPYTPLYHSDFEHDYDLRFLTVVTGTWTSRLYLRESTGPPWVNWVNGAYVTRPLPYNVQADMRMYLEANQLIAFSLRRLDVNNLVHFELRMATGVVRVQSLVVGVWGAAYDVALVLGPNIWYRVRGSLVGNRARMWVNDVLTHDVSDASFEATGGRCLAFHNLGGAARFDEVSVRRA